VAKPDPHLVEAERVRREFERTARDNRDARLQFWIVVRALRWAVDQANANLKKAAE
jgi:hypothetical protein